ncbi:MAG: type II secretion system secretin GspD [Nitrospiraceae bacterium]|nr:type II secretion system secretin GspD [Nitrospiraceae bacterium]
MNIRLVVYAVLVLAMGCLLGWPAHAQENVDAEKVEELVGEEIVEHAAAADADALEVETAEKEAPMARPTPIRPPMPSGPRTVQPSRRGIRRSVPARPAVTTPKAGQPSDDSLLKDGGIPSEPVSFDYTDTPLTEVVKAIGRMTGKNFDIDPGIASMRVTVVTHDKIPPELAYQVLEALLTARGYNLVETIPGHLIRVVPAGENTEKIGIVKGTKGVPESYDQLSTHIVNVQYADAGECAAILQKLGSRSSVVDAYQRTNTLIITDTADGLRRMFTFLEDIDIPGFDTQLEIFTLEYARAEVLSQQIQEVLTEAGAAPKPKPTRTTTARTRTSSTRLGQRPNIPGQAAPMIIGSAEQVLRIVSDERLNALIVTATTSIMDQVRDLVTQLDTPTPYERNSMNVYPLLNASAEDVESALNSILGVAPRQGSDKGAAQSGEIQPFEKKVLITRYEQTNSLLILAAPQDYKLIKEIIAQLDVPQRQVLIEAVIMDVSVQDTFGLSVDSAALTGNDGFGMSNPGNISSLIQTANLATSLADGTAGITTASSLLSLGAAGGLTAGIYDKFTATVNGQKIEIPFVPLLLRALSTLTDIDILSQPSLTALDNEPASIIVGQEIPVPSQRSGYSYDPRTGTSQDSRYGLTSYGSGINREDVGVKMTVTPHINEGDYVSIETEIEVSEATPSSVGIDSNELGPTFNKTQVNNIVVVKDGMTGVIGGLLKETTSHSSSQTPGLGDLPLLGWLFRTKSDSRKKQNVVVLITPYIIKDGGDHRRVTDFKMDEFRAANVDVLFEQGIIKRFKKRNRLRSKYWPSAQRAQDMLDSKGFGRGDIER